MVNATEIDAAKMPSIHALEATNFFLADVQTGLGPMGHTHYNELANDGRTLYSATRSTGQIEEGPVGYSITNIDGDAVSWRFVALGKLPVVVITSPSDARRLTNSGGIQGTLKVRAELGPSTVCSAPSLDPTNMERSGNASATDRAHRSALDRRRQHRSDVDAPLRSL